MLNIYILYVHFLKIISPPMKSLHMPSISASPPASAYTSVMLTPAEVFLTPADLIAQAKPKHDSLQHFD